MINKTILLVLICITNIIQSQNRYEDFAVNDKIGIIETETLTEFIAPTFDFNYNVNINNTYFTYRDKDTLKIFNKKNGEWEKPIFTPKFNSFLIDGAYYFQSILNNKTVLIDSLFQPKFYFEKRFSNFEKLVENYICVQDNGVFKIFKINKNKHELVHTVKALHYVFKNINELNGGNERVLVFFGGEKTHVFTQKVVLKKVHNVKITNEYAVYDLINPISAKLTLSDGNGGNYNLPKPNPAEFIKINADNNLIKKYASDSSSFIFLTSFDHDLRSYDSKNFIVYKVFITENKYGGTTTTIGSKNSYRFKIDEKKLRIFLPNKYMQEIGGLELLSK